VNAIAIESTAGGSRAWVATARGLTSIEGESVHTYGGGGVLPSTQVHAVAALPSGGVLVGTERGAAMIKDGAETRIDDKQGVALRAVWAVAEAPGNVLLLGSSAGLYYGTPASGWKKVSIASGHLRDDWITSLAVSGPDVYVGTYNGGVTRLVFAGGELTLGEHLGGGYINPGGLFVDRGVLYAATMDGLLARTLSTGTLSTGTWRVLPSTGKDVTGVLAIGGDLWVASRRGLVKLAMDPAR
jgi:ligand-binding sensor domain-containing protein